MMIVGGVQTNSPGHVWREKWTALSGPLSQVSMECHTDAITCLVVDANFLFTGSDDATIRIWDVQVALLLGRLIDIRLPEKGNSNAQ